MDIREARKEDCRQIRRLIQELAEFEKMADGPKISYEVLERDGFQADPPLFKAFVAVSGDIVVGHALYYYTYSSWEGRSMFLDELYLTPEYRNKGIGSKLFDTVAKKAADERCCRLDFSVLNWNEAREMYKHKGAVHVTTAGGWNHWRLAGQALKKYQTVKAPKTKVIQGTFLAMVLPRAWGMTP